MGGTSRPAMLGCVTLLILSVSEATALTGNEYRILQTRAASCVCAWRIRQ